MQKSQAIVITAASAFLATASLLAVSVHKNF